ncbi:MAG: phosphoadenosine phosphosulfate reductase family protein, partial [Steroidobacteraceae bacterium]
SMLFPDSAAAASKWFAAVQWKGQREYCSAVGAQVLLLGRRQADGNMTGPEGRYMSNGVLRYSPMWDWSHEDVFHLLGAYRVPLPPNYGWANGFRLGTGPWPKRRRIEHSELATWRAVAAVDRSVVEAAAAYFPLAREAAA